MSLIVHASPFVSPKPLAIGRVLFISHFRPTFQLIQEFDIVCYPHTRSRHIVDEKYT